MKFDNMLSLVHTFHILISKFFFKKDQKIRWKVLKELKSPSLQDVMEFVEKQSLTKQVPLPESKRKTKSDNSQTPKSLNQPRRPVSEANASGGRNKSRIGPNPVNRKELKPQAAKFTPTAPNVQPRMPMQQYNPATVQQRNMPIPVNHMRFDATNSNANLNDMPQYGVRGTGNQNPGRGICNFCGYERHSSEGTKISWREKCPARNSICHDCKEIGHFKDMPACRLKQRDNVIIIKQTSR